MAHQKNQPDPALFERISDTIWDYAEPRFREVKSAGLLSKALEDHGFSVERGIAGLSTAFCASFGSGSPVIAVLGEYDALPGLSQERDAAERRTAAGRTCGHGCGHHLIGTGAAEAAVRIKNYLQETGRAGTIRYYGCPAEEGGSGKIFMIRAGCFDDVDACFAWHPSGFNGVWNTCLASVRVMYHFRGVSAHAAACPHKGRSALDAAELMNIGVNFLREHVTPDVRLHYAFINAGGVQPNIVLDTVDIVNVARADSIQTVQELYDRLQKMAQGAALMTETQVSSRVQLSYYSFLPNGPLEKLVARHLREETVAYTEEEIRYGDRFGAESNILRKKDLFAAQAISGSTDVADVSWVVPTVQVASVCGATDALHSWQFTAQGCSSIAHKGMHFAAGVIARSAMTLYSEPERLSAIRDFWEAEKQGAIYRSLLPEDLTPEELQK